MTKPFSKRVGVFMLAAFSWLGCGDDDEEKGKPDGGTDQDAGTEDDAGTDGGGGGDACDDLCTAASFTSGQETDFGGGLVECLCTGAGDGLTEEACDDYCSEFGVAPEDALLSTKTTTNDKCVCDGTGG